VRWVEQENPSRNRSARRTARRAAWSLLAAAFFSAACIPRSDKPIIRQTDDDAGGPPPISGDAAVDSGLPPNTDPHALLGVQPPHGSFAGGTLVLLRGNGFASDARVWFGDRELPASDVLALDPQRLQVTAPPGIPGAADVTVQNGDDDSTRATLEGGFTYDDFYLTPETGPTSGGTIVTLRSRSPLFEEGVEVEVDLQPCEIESIVSPTELTCRTPPGTPGAKRVGVSVPSGDESVDLDVLDAFTYVISDDGFRGGLAGNPLNGSIKVLALDDYSGAAIPGATVLVGDSLDTAQTATTDRYGTAQIEADLGERASVTIAKHCFQPVTFVDVPVDTVTAYLSPVMSPSCGDAGELPAGGGVPGRGATVTGEVVWELTGEFRRAGWTNVPAPRTDFEHSVAYVFRLASEATSLFSLPSAIAAITPDSEGDIGYSFTLSTTPGNFTVYTLAGLEDRSHTPYTFTPYAMGITRGVSVAPGGRREDIFIDVDLSLDHALTVDSDGPKPTSRGPDRMRATLAIEIGTEGFVILPNSRLETALPAADPFRFVGIPALAGALSGARYVATAAATTGSAGGPPLSAVGLFATTTEGTLGLGEFLEVPKLEQPASSAQWNGTELEITREPGGAVSDLTLFDIASANGLVTWRIVAPGAPSSVKVPDLGALDGDVGLIRGPIVIQVTAARADDFEYGALRYRSLAPRGWRAYASDVFFAEY
jgi:hypothetical protein